LEDIENISALQQGLKAPPIIPDNNTILKCSAGMYSFHVACNGDLSFCSIYRNGAANLRDTRFKEGWARMVSERNKPKMAKTSCDNCKLNSICVQCPGINALYGEGPQFKDEYICAYTHALSRMMENAVAAVKDGETGANPDTFLF
jgi:radical SAM protein with 4Fe4S-binding SPASM domain